MIDDSLPLSVARRRFYLISAAQLVVAQFDSSQLILCQLDEDLQLLSTIVLPVTASKPKSVQRLGIQSNLQFDEFHSIYIYIYTANLQKRFKLSEDRSYATRLKFLLTISVKRPLFLTEQALLSLSSTGGSRRYQYTDNGLSGMPDGTLLPAYTRTFERQGIIVHRSNCGRGLYSQRPLAPHEDNFRGFSPHAQSAAKIDTVGGHPPSTGTVRRYRPQAVPGGFGCCIDVRIEYALYAGSSFVGHLRVGRRRQPPD